MQRARDVGFEEALVDAFEAIEREAPPRRTRAGYVPSHDARVCSHLQRLHGLGLLADSDAEQVPAPGDANRPSPERRGDSRR